MNKEVEILKIGSIMKTNGKDTIMVVLDGGPIFDQYISILKEKCDEYKYLKTYQSVIGTPDIRPDRFSKFNKNSIQNEYQKYEPNTLKGIQRNNPVVGNSYVVDNWKTSVVMRIIDEDILITSNSVYVIHNPSKIRDKILNDLGIN